jgi:hypothetical protein
MTGRFHNSLPDRWTNPRPQQDPCQRRMKHGPIVPMHEEGWAIAFGTALAGFALKGLRPFRRSDARRYRKGLGR